MHHTWQCPGVLCSRIALGDTKESIRVIGHQTRVGHIQGMFLNPCTVSGPKYMLQPFENTKSMVYLMYDLTFIHIGFHNIGNYFVKN